MVSLKVSQKSPTKYSTLYRWNGHFGHLSEVIKIYKYQFWTFWTIAFNNYKAPRSMTLTKTHGCSLVDHLNGLYI